MRVKKVGPFTQSVGTEMTSGKMWEGLGHEFYAAPGATQHHDRVLRREKMGQKMTPKDDVRNIKRGR